MKIIFITILRLFSLILFLTNFSYSQTVILMLNKNAKIINNRQLNKRILFKGKEKIFTFSLSNNERHSNTGTNSSIQAIA